MARKKASTGTVPSRPLRQVHFQAPACTPDDPAFLAFLETAMQLTGNWPFTILETTVYTDPGTGQLMLDALLEVPPYPSHTPVAEEEPGDAPV